MFGTSMAPAVGSAVASGFSVAEPVTMNITRATGVMGFLYVGLGVAMAGTLLRVLFRHGGVLVEHTSGMLAPVADVDDWDSLSNDDKDLYRGYYQDAYAKAHGGHLPDDVRWD